MIEYKYYATGTINRRNISWLKLLNSILYSAITAELWAIYVSIIFWISFDSCFFNYYADDDEIQFNLAGQEGVVTIPSVISYDKVDEEDLFEDAVAGYTATLESGDTVTFYCFNAKNKG